MPLPELHVKSLELTIWAVVRGGQNTLEAEAVPLDAIHDIIKALWPPGIKLSKVVLLKIHRDASVLEDIEDHLAQLRPHAITRDQGGCGPALRLAHRSLLLRGEGLASLDFTLIIFFPATLRQPSIITHDYTKI